MILGPIQHKTKIRFQSMDDFESYKNAIDIDFDIGDVTFTGYVYQLNTPQLKVFEQSPYAKGTNYMHKHLNVMDKTVI